MTIHMSETTKNELDPKKYSIRKRGSIAVKVYHQFILYCICLIVKKSSHIRRCPIPTYGIDGKRELFCILLYCLLGRKISVGLIGFVWL